MTETLDAPAATIQPMGVERMEELALILGEECAEVIQETSKLKRFGLDTVKPGCPKKSTPRDRLETEIGDVFCMVKMLVDGGVLDMERITAAAKEKRPRVLSTLKSSPY